MPGRPRLLRRLRRMGPNRPEENVRGSGPIRGGQLVLPRGGRGPPSSLAGDEGLPEPGVDQAHQHADPDRRVWQHATRDSRQLYFVDPTGIPFGICGFQVPARPVAEVQLRVVGGTRRWAGVHGGVVVPVFGAGGD